MRDEISRREAGLQRGLTAGQMGMIAIGGAIGTGLFLGSGYATNIAGPSVLLSFAIGAVISLLLIGCLAEMTVAHPTAGSFGASAERYIGPWAGFLVRYTYWAGMVLAIGPEISAVDTYMRYWTPNAHPGLWASVIAVALIAANALNVKVFGAIEYVFSSFKVAAIIAFILIGCFVLIFMNHPGMGFANYVSNGGFMPHGFVGTWNATLIAVFSYTSIEMIAVAAGEAVDPRRAIVTAFRGTVVRLVLFYLLSIALMLAIVPWQQAGAGGSPFVKVMEIINIPGAAGILNFVVLIAALSAMNSLLYTTTRMLFSLSRAGHAPAAFSKLTRRGSPVAALMLSSLGGVFGVVLTVFWPKQAFIWMIAIVMFALMFVWMMIFVTHFFFRRSWKERHQTLPFRIKGYPYWTIAGLLLMLSLMISTAFFDDFKLTLATGIPFLAALSLLYFVKYRRSGSSIAGRPATPEL
ncbi:amino acid permease [Paraburkholderia flagellata]|uniref:amino acid permease n=1 Tax=Paraburkholderia flagellata TaxID=2883241 RepID=UPI001F1E79DB|nr:amino acid permease [Paraburkholderia flagellata]